MTILILFLMLYSVFGVNLKLEIPINKGKWYFVFNTGYLLMIIATILYCIHFFQCISTP